MFFVDDSLFFIRGKVEKARNLLEIIGKDCLASAHKVNFEKSSLLFNAATDEEYKREVTGIFSVRQVMNPGMYLVYLLFGDN